MGPRRIWGNRAIIVAKASTVAEPVVLVSHQTSANWTSWLPTKEKACPVQITKNEVRGLDCLSSSILPIPSMDLPRDSPLLLAREVTLLGRSSLRLAFQTVPELDGQRQVVRVELGYTQLSHHRQSTVVVDLAGVDL
jgi:hypothetical protein